LVFLTIRVFTVVVVLTGAFFFGGSVFARSFFTGGVGDLFMENRPTKPEMAFDRSSSSLGLSGVAAFFGLVGGEVFFGLDAGAALGGLTRLTGAGFSTS
jgi:hypothetical protein